MALTKKLAVLAMAGLALSATACGSKTEEATPATTAAPASTTTTEKASTTTEKPTSTTEKASTPKVTKPVKVEKIETADLPAAAQTLPSGFGFTQDEEDCVNTIIYTYAQDPSNATDDASLSGVVGQAIALCVDQEKLAVAIVDSVREAAPELTDTQASCLENEIATADVDSLGIFLGAFTYEGPGSEELQEPFLTALDDACGLST